MAKSLSVFNNKGGVGKTTFLFHIANILADDGACVLMVDCDSQCNLTAYSLSDAMIEKAWADDGNSIFRMIEPVARTVGDIRNRAPSKLRKNLYLIPGDLVLSDFEDRLGDTWNGTKGGSEPGVRAQSAIFRVINQAADKVGADITLIDLGPNLGALNRSVLGGTDMVLVPIAPDLFSIRGTENLGSKLQTWRAEWDQINAAWRSNDIAIPKGQPRFIGYVVQQHNIRNNSAGMTKGWQLFGNRVEAAVRDNIVERLEPLGQAVKWDDGNYNLGLIPNLHSLMAYSLEARKPVYACTSSDGLRGAHIESARASRAFFSTVAGSIANLLED